MSTDNIYFLKGKENCIDEKKDKDPISKIQDSFSKVIDGKNLSFLLGAGCSSFVTDGVDVGIPTMSDLAKEFLDIENVAASDEALTEEEKTWLVDKLRLDVSKRNYKNNLETFLGTLFSLNSYFASVGYEEADEHASHKGVKDIIIKTRNFILEKVLNESNRSNGKDSVLLELYQTFYRKLLYRNANLAKTNIFTTNYDLYSETALDNLGIHYANGFSGGIKKYFNPTIFNYALSEKMDLSQNKWNVIDNFIYLYKLHGSVNWIEDSESSKLFRVREIEAIAFEELKKKENIMIHPTPLKQNASLGSPYSDLFREFQKKIMQNNNVLVTIGYSFNDEHVNNLIYQAFTIPSFRLIILGNPESSVEMEKIKSLDDPRVWFIYGTLEDDTKLQYFKGFVENILPELSNDEVDSKIEAALKTLLTAK